MKTYIAVLTIIFLSFYNETNAQYTDLINSNRPGLSQSAFAVGIGVTQLELGGKYLKEKRKTHPNYSSSGYGVDFAIHHGLLLESMELMLEGSYQNDTKTTNTSVTQSYNRANFNHLTFSIKYLLFDPLENSTNEKPNIYSYHANRKFKWKDLLPAVAISAGLNYDTKDNPFIPPEVSGMSYKGMLITQHNFRNGWTLTSNTFLNRIASKDPDFNYIITVSRALNPSWVVFGETQGIKSDFYADNLIRFGGAYLYNKNLQLDTGITLNIKDTPSVFNVGLGISYRLDKHTDDYIIDPNYLSELKKQEKLKRKASKNKKKKKRKKNKG